MANSNDKNLVQIEVGLVDILLAHALKDPEIRVPIFQSLRRTLLSKLLPEDVESYGEFLAGDYYKQAEWLAERAKKYNDKIREAIDQIDAKIVKEIHLVPPISEQQ